MLQQYDAGGNNTISCNFIHGVYCEASDAILGSRDIAPGEGGQNSILDNEVFDAGIYKGSYVLAEYNWWGDDFDPPGAFEVDDDATFVYDPWLSTDPNSCGMQSIASKSNETEVFSNPQTLLPIEARRIVRERAQGNFAVADSLVRRIVVDRTLPNDVRCWALGQLIPIGERTRNKSLTAYFISVSTTQPLLARRAKALLPLRYIHDGLMAEANAAYESNIQEYPNSELERFGMFGSFVYQLYGRNDVANANNRLSRLQIRYAQNAEARIAVVQLRNFWLSPAHQTNGSAAKGQASSLLANEIPKSYALWQNYPNPFNPTTTIKYDLPFEGHVILKVYDVLGREVITLVDDIKDAGFKSVTFDASGLASGVYLYQLKSDGFVQTRKLMLLR